MKKEKILGNLSAEEFENYVTQTNSSALPKDLKSVSSASLSFISNLKTELRNDSITITALKRVLNITPKELPSASNDNDSTQNTSDSNSEKENPNQKKEKRTRTGGKKGFKNYPDAQVERICHETLAHGDLCPDCSMGKLYNVQDGKSLSFRGNAPIDVLKYLIERFRCNSCGNHFNAKFNKPKWQHSARTMAIISKLNGIPFYRLSKIQSMFGVPISNSTLWIQCLDTWEECAKNIYAELLSEAQKSPNLYFDDTGANILEFYNSEKACHTTIVCASNHLGQDILIYMTKNGYSGENVAPLIKDCKNFMSDASSMNIPHIDKEQLKKLVQFKCLYHAKAKFDELVESYPNECKYFLDQISSIYAIEKKTKEESLSAKDRLKLHQEHSSVYVENIYKKIAELFDNRLIEPNNRLGQAMRYWLNHKDGLTMFLRVQGMALDNNISERNLKPIILQRKNSMFFATAKSAEILSGLASIVFTCYVNDINPVNYLNWLQDNASKTTNNAVEYMPWKYQEFMNDTEKIVVAA